MQLVLLRFHWGGSCMNLLLSESRPRCRWRILPASFRGRQAQFHPIICPLPTFRCHLLTCFIHSSHPPCHDGSSSLLPVSRFQRETSRSRKECGSTRHKKATQLSANRRPQDRPAILIGCGDLLHSPQNRTQSLMSESDIYAFSKQGVPGTRGHFTIARSRTASRGLYQGEGRI